MHLFQLVFLSRIKCVAALPDGTNHTRIRTKRCKNRKTTRHSQQSLSGSKSGDCAAVIFSPFCSCSAECAYREAERRQGGPVAPRVARAAHIVHNFARGDRVGCLPWIVGSYLEQFFLGALRIHSPARSRSVDCQHSLA